MPQNVGFVRSEVTAKLGLWTLIRDCLEGQAKIKSAKDTYLPRPNASDTSDENKKRYDAYLERAVFYNVTRRTLDGLVGQVFIRDPDSSIPTGLEAFDVDVDGAGVGIQQQAKRTLADTMSFGRVGLLADYPPVQNPSTLEEMQRGYIRPTIVLYQPEQIINWRTTVVGARKLVSLVVLRETYPVDDDGFETKIDNQWRVLRLIKGEYVVQLWRYVIPEKNAISTSGVPAAHSGGDYMLFQEFRPKDAEGKPLREIPFVFIGATDNDPDIDQAPLYDLAVLNIAHYRNSADYEEASFLVGQPTPWFAGLTENWVKNVLKGEIKLGSRAGVSLPEGGMAGLLQVQANSMPKEAMDAKERQMVALGARLVEQREVQRTLGEAQLEEASQASILTSVTKNVSAAYRQALTWCALFTGTNGDIKYDLNTDFPAARMSPDERAQLIAEWQASAISKTEMRTALRKAGVATQDDATAQEEIDSDPPPMVLTKPLGGKSNGSMAPSQNGKTMGV